MTNQITITQESNRISVSSPYNKDYVARAREMGGKWSPTEKTWTFDEAVRDELMAELFTRYGYTGDDNPDMVDVEVDAYFFEEGNRIVVGGLQVAYRYGRDTKVRLTEGWRVAKGSLTGSGGSRANPTVLGHNQFDGDLILRGQIPTAVYDSLEGNQKEHTILV